MKADFSHSILVSADDNHSTIDISLKLLPRRPIIDSHSGTE